MCGLIIGPNWDLYSMLFPLMLELTEQLQMLVNLWTNEDGMRPNYISIYPKTLQNIHRST